MGRIIAQTKVTNLTDESKSVQCGMFVDTGAAALILPAAWRDKLGSFPREEQVGLVRAFGQTGRWCKVPRARQWKSKSKVSAGRQRGDVR